MTQKFDPRALPITTALAAALLATGCSRGPDTANRNVAVCTDRNGYRVDDSNCNRRSGGVGGHGWYYLGKGSAVPGFSERATGGSRTPVMGGSYARASAATVTRGGFGMSAHSSGG